MAQASLVAAYNLPSAVSTSQYNAANQQLAFGSYRLLYDADGNVTNIINGSATNTLQWSARNQLTNILGAVTATFLYDGLGRRITRSVSGTTEKYLYDGLDIIQQLDNTGTVAANYFRGLAIDEPWQLEQGAFSGSVTNGLVGWWKCEEGSGMTAADSSGNGNTGTLQTGASWGSGVTNNAIMLDGSAGYVDVGAKAILEDNTNWTFAAWINPDTFNSTRDTWLFYKQNVLQWGFPGGSSRQLSVNIGNGNNNGLQGAVTNSAQLGSNIWTHVTVTYTNSTVKFYVNGALVETFSKTYTMGDNKNKSFSISTSGQSFDGKLDDLRYFKRALSDSEIADIYGQSLTNSYFLADGLGGIVALTDSSKNITNQYSYEPFGATTATGPASKNSYEFTGRENDGTGLYYYRARYYHPALGRFVSEDPMEFAGGDMNLYAYVSNNSINANDPSGLTLQSNADFLLLWLLGLENRVNYYGPDDFRTEEMMGSPGARLLRRQFYRTGCVGVERFTYGTYRAAWDTIVNPFTRDLSSTALQVGGFGNATAVNNGNGTVTYTIPNYAGTKSFFYYHKVPDRTGEFGPMRTVYQEFTWTDPIQATSTCNCK